MSQAILKALLGARDAMLEIRYHMRKMGEAAGIPVCSLSVPFLCHMHFTHGFISDSKVFLEVLSIGLPSKVFIPSLAASPSLVIQLITKLKKEFCVFYLVLMDI